MIDVRQVMEAVTANILWLCMINVCLLHLFTQGKPKQLTLVFIGFLHSFHIVTNMYVQNIIQYSQIARTWRILKHYIYNIIQVGLQGHVNTRFYEVHVWTRSNKLLFVIVDVSRSTWLHHLQQNSWRGQCHTSRLSRFTNMCKWCEQICHVPIGVIRFTHFLYLTLSENESQFSLENVSADGVKKAHCKIIRQLFQT